MGTDYDPNYKPNNEYFLVGGKVIIINSDGRILLLLRSNKVVGGGKWSLPGGAVERGEDAIDAAEREVLEETEMKIKNIRAFAVKTHTRKGKNSVIVIGYIAELESGEIELNWEHDEHKWVKPEKALESELTEGCEYFVRRYLKLKVDNPNK